MGSSVSSERLDRGTTLEHQQIENELQREKTINHRVVKLLLLGLLIIGAGESGKSTLLKQMKIIHAAGFASADYAYFRKVVFGNLVQAMTAVLEAMDSLKLSFENPKREEDAKVVTAAANAVSDSALFTEQLMDAVKRLWADSAIQKCIFRSNQLKLNDSAIYFLTNLSRIRKPDYKPTLQDILRSRVSTTGIVEMKFVFKSQIFRLFDVGGQRSERRKWIHIFDNVTGVIFVVSLSDYDQPAPEEPTMNRLVEALELFEELANNQYFVRSTMILFLNKKDLFKEKVKRIHLTVCFPDYKGKCDFDQASSFVAAKFLKTTGKRVFAHLTCATDTHNIQAVFDAVANAVLTANTAQSAPA